MEKNSSEKVQPTNEDIVNDLTKDFDAKLGKDGTNACDQTGENSSKSSEIEDETNIVEEALNKDESDNELDIEEDESVRREHESNWTEDEKQKHKDESLQLKTEGNRLFSEKNYKEASRIYSKALLQCPLSCTHERSVLYSNRAACKMRQEKKKEAVTDCTKALELNPNYLKALLRRAQLHRELEKLDEALTDYQRVLEIDGNILEARQAVVTLPEEIKDRNEKLKTEMMGKLKDLGNVILRPFGLSTENFKLVQDPNSGGYSINFQNNK